MEDEIIEAYEDEGYVMELEPGEYNEDDIQNEFQDFEEYDPDQQEYQVGYQHQQHMGFIDPVYGTGLANMSKTGKMLQIMSIPREKLFIREIRFELLDVFSSQDTVNFYVNAIEEHIPRYWTTNPKYLVEAIETLHFKKQITKDILLQTARSRGMSAVDLLRYCYFVNKYLGIGTI